MLTPVGAFVDQPSAELARARLLLEGIESNLRDQYVIGVNWLYSTAIGGVKLEVAEAQSEEAVRILADEQGSLLEGEGEVGVTLCASCGAREVVPYRPLRIVAALTLFPAWPLALVIGLPFVDWRARWRCLNCRRKWR